ncbi:MAG TPA: chemotaxis protein, partial [Methanothermococcus okinawensis]|nr:chemotaxis protein [Methanothermococcus okinawensis]
MKISNMSVKTRLCISMVLLIIIFLSIAAFAIVMSKDIIKDGRIVGIAGKQRTLVVNTAKYALMVSMGHLEYKEKMIKSAEEFDRTLNDLINGNPERGIPPAPEDIQQQLLKVKELWDPFYEKVKILYTKDPSDPEFKEALEYIKNHNMEIFAEMHKAVGMYVEEIEKEMSLLDNILTMGGITGLLIAVVSMVFIRRTVIRHLKELDRITDEMANRNYNVEPKIKFYNDEIGKIY